MNIFRYVAFVALTWDTHSLVPNVPRVFRENMQDNKYGNSHTKFRTLLLVRAEELPGSSTFLVVNYTNYNIAAT